MLIKRLEQDIEVIKLKQSEIQQEAQMIRKQATNCQEINTSVHFMNLSMTSKYNMVRNRAKNFMQDQQGLIEEAKKDLEKEVLAG
jgi:hypothetical protein